MEHFYDKSWFLWLQFAYLIWLIVRPAAFFRLPWCGIMGVARWCLRMKPVNQNVSMYFAAGMKHSIEPSQYLAGKGDYRERLRRDANVDIFPVKRPSSATAIRGFGKCIVVGQEDLENVTCIFCNHMDKQRFVKEYLRVNGFMKIVRLCDLDSALRMYFSNKLFSIRGRESTQLIEYSPLQSSGHWMLSVVATLPLLLQAKNYQLASAGVTLVTYFLDLFSNRLAELFDGLWMWTVRLVQFCSNWLPTGYKIVLYYCLCNFDTAFMPGCLDDFKIKRREITKFLFLQNALLTEDVEVVEEFEPNIPHKITAATVNTLVELWCFNIRCTFKSVDADGFLTFTAYIQGILHDKVSHTYKVPVRNFFLLVDFLRWVKKENVPGLVFEIKTGGLMEAMVCLGFSETINAFWEPGVKIFQGKFSHPRTFLIGDTGTNLFCDT